MQEEAKSTFLNFIESKKQFYVIQPSNNTSTLKSIVTVMVACWDMNIYTVSTAG